MLENPTLVNPTLENPTQINKDKTITKELNKDLIKYQSINQSDAATDSIPPDNRWIDRYNQNETRIKIILSTKHFCIATTAQPLCKDRDTYFCAAVDGIAPEYKSTDGEVFRPEAGIGSATRKGGTNIVTPTYDEAVHTIRRDMRRLRMQFAQLHWRGRM